ncbi:MAG: hypothetical protein WDZ79_02840 [Candidatus Paceibacterota bacterium]
MQTLLETVIILGFLVVGGLMVGFILICHVAFRHTVHVVRKMLRRRRAK